MEGLPRSEQRKKKIFIDFVTGIKLLVITSLSFVILLKTWLMQIECVPKLPRTKVGGQKSIGNHLTISEKELSLLKQVPLLWGADILP